MNRSLSQSTKAWLTFLSLAVLTACIYGFGVNGGYLFDDYPNIVDNTGVHPPDASVASLIRSALSSPSSELKRPLASLSFAINYLTTGDDPAPMKVTNIVIHLLNGLLVFIFSRQVLGLLGGQPASREGASVIAALVAGLWLLLPINLTAVLYIVQRMESLANFFVLAGLIGYTHARWRMQASLALRWPVVALVSVVGCTVLGLTAKETAVMLPMYAFVVDLCAFRLRSLRPSVPHPALDKRVVIAYGFFLLLPALAGLAWLMPGLLNTAGWATRNFTLSTRLLTELRVVPAYIGWILFPTSHALSFYHDDWIVSTSLLSPWTTLAGALAIVALSGLAWWARRRQPHVTLGILLYLSAHLLTGTVLPLELVYEHRNYFASLGILVAVVPLLTKGATAPMPLVRRAILGIVFIQSTLMLYTTARAWDNPLSLARELADRAPQSPRALYELGRTYIILSKYDPSSPFIPLVYAPLERAMALPESSILPEQALIFFHARMHRPLRDAWWDSMTKKLAARKATIQDESSLGALNQCMESKLCDLPVGRMGDAFLAALSHEGGTARLLAMYSDFAWNALNDKQLGLRVAMEAMHAKPDEPAYHVSVIRMLAVLGRLDEARRERDVLARMNVGGSLDGDLASIDKLLQR